MPNNWKTYKLSEVIEYIGRGISPKYTDNLNIKVINQRCIRDNKIIYETCRYHELEKKSISDVKYLKKHDVLVNSTGVGTLGRVAQFKSDFKDITVDSHVSIVRPVEDYADEFFGYAIIEKQALIESLGEGSTGQTELSRTRLGEEVFLCLPESKKERKEIASILSAIDDKIENNLAINKTIEEMAMALYKHWFVDFGPFQDGEFVESELGRIPKGWEVKKITDLIEVKDGTHDSPKRVEDGFYLITSKHIMTNSIDFSSAYKISCDDYNKINKRSLVEKGDILMTMIGTVGNFYFVNEEPNYVIKNLGLFKTSKSPLLKIYLFSFFNSKIGQEYIKSQMTGSTQQYVTLKTLRNFDIIVPDEQILLDYNYLANDYFEKILINIKENQTLTQLRDTLLPKLISGEVRLKEFQES